LGLARFETVHCGQQAMVQWRQLEIRLAVPNSRPLAGSTLTSPVHKTVASRSSSKRSPRDGLRVHLRTQRDGRHASQDAPGRTDPGHTRGPESDLVSPCQANPETGQATAAEGFQGRFRTMGLPKRPERIVSPALRCG
jgi:hypothetical protein